ncbi:MAG TPA: RHS repeat-associated core domain-containing protein, partial [Clostridia bacterium]|nr:RHS repeat-associated core domain-containing protein [Clostridia bacterium]
DGSSESLTYDARDLVTSRTDALGGVTYYGYDPLGWLVAVTNALGYVTQNTYDSLGRLETRTDQNGLVTTFHYDPLGRLTQTVFADGSSESSTYDAAGRRVTTTDANGHTTGFAYDPLGHLVGITNALNEVTTFGYDELGRRTQVVDALGRTNRFEYDAVGRLVRALYPDGSASTFLYDVAGRRTAVVDEAGVTNLFGYDALGRLTSVTNALGHVTTYVYDALGRLSSQTDANQHTTTFEYDALGRRVKRTLPGGELETMAYDPAGNLTNRVDFNGRACAYEYAPLGQLLRRTPDPVFGEPPVTWTYDPAGARTNMTNAAGSTAWRYDAQYRLVEKMRSWSEDGASASLLYAYDPIGNVTNVSSTSTNGVRLAYAYDALNRLTQVQDPLNGTTTFGYDPVGNLSGVARPNGLRTGYFYDARDRATNVTTIDASLAVLSQYLYAHGPAGNRLTTDETVLFGGQTNHLARAYSYDSLYRLTGETLSNNTQVSTLTYAYDPVGNRLSRTTSGFNPGFLDSASYSYTANDQLASDTYDANGNTLLAPGCNQLQPDQYDSADRLIRRAATINNQPATIHFQYDGEGNRVSKKIGTQTTHYLIDELNPTGYAQVLEESTMLPPPASTLAATKVYTYGPYGPLSQDQIVGNAWAATHFGHDAHGNVRYLSDAVGQVTDTFDYDAFGSLVGRSGTTPTTRLFTGEEFDPELGLYHLRARYHNPATGRFWSRDSFEGFVADPRSLHPYTYTYNDPVNNLDPSGYETLAELSAVSSIAVYTSQAMASLWNGINRYGYGVAGGAAAGPDGKAVYAQGEAEVLFIQGLSQHVGINLGRDNFYATMKGAPFLLAHNPLVYVMRNDCFRYGAVGFDADGVLYGCPNRNPAFTFDFSNDPMYQFAEGLADIRGAARGVWRGGKDLAAGTFVLAENVLGAVAYNQVSRVSPQMAQMLFGPQAEAFNQTVLGLGQLGWDLANGVAYKAIAPFAAEYAQEAYGANLQRLNQMLLNATGGGDVGAAERTTYTLTQLFLPGGVAKGASATRTAATVIMEANAGRFAVYAGRAAEALAQARATATAALEATTEALSGARNCLTQNLPRPRWDLGRLNSFPGGLFPEWKWPLSAEIDEIFSELGGSQWDLIEDAYVRPGRGMRDPAVRSTADTGSLIHQEFAKVVKRKGWQSELEMKGRSGNFYRPDAVTPDGWIIELKPNTPSGRLEGEAKRRLYEREFGTKVRIIYYDE